MGKNKSSCERSPEGFRIYKPEGDSELLEVGSDNEVVAVVDMGLQALRGYRLRGKEPLYSPDAEGLRRFSERIESYFEELNRINASRDSKNAVLPDIESLANWLGMTRKTLCLYHNERGKEWAEEIELAKQTITAVKKQLLVSGKGNSIGLIFDLVNNSGYRSTNEFHLESAEPVAVLESPEERRKRLLDKYRVAPNETDAHKPYTDTFEG